MFEKTHVNGKEACDIYQYLRNNSTLYNKDKKTAADISWNFAKFLVNGEGQVVKYADPRTNPFAMKADIMSML